MASIRGKKRTVDIVFEKDAPRNADRGLGVARGVLTPREVRRRKTWNKDRVIAGFRESGMVVENPGFRACQGPSTILEQGFTDLSRDLSPLLRCIYSA